MLRDPSTIERARAEVDGRLDGQGAPAEGREYAVLGYAEYHAMIGDAGGPTYLSSYPAGGGAIYAGWVWA